MMRTLWANREIVDELGRMMRLEYYLLTEESDGMDLYGVEVLALRGDEQDTCSRPKLTPQPKKIVDLIALLAEQTVTATTLDDVLQDLL